MPPVAKVANNPEILVGLAHLLFIRALLVETFRRKSQAVQNKMKELVT
jgi:hypothetical protein